MRFGVLGPLMVIGADGADVCPAAPRLRRLLLGLVLWRGEPVSADRLVDVVWSAGPLARDPIATLRTYVTRLRSVLEPEHVGGRATILTGGPDHYTLDLRGHELDADAFERDVQAASAILRDDPARALACLDVATARWRGTPFLDVADETWAQPEVARLEELHVTAEEHRSRCLIDLHRSDEAIGELERQVRLRPLRERPHGLLMTALDRSGRNAEAAAVFRDFGERLRSEAGLDPSEDLQQLHLRLLEGGGATTFASADPGRWDRVPAVRTGLFGRDDDLVVLGRLLELHRIVTIAGTGGVGKTRLAVELAQRALEDGEKVVFAELGGVTDGAGVVDAVFEGLRLPAVGRRDGIDGLARLFRPRRSLLVLDNCEHQLDATLQLVHRLTEEAPDLTVLATSREPLGAEGERIHRLPSLDAHNATKLFRVRAVEAGFTGTFDDDDTAAMGEVCRRLDGIPLAIEFAAARAAHLSVLEIAQRLDERFWLLTGGQRNLARHQTLEAAIAWSYELLPPDERALLRAAAAFVDGFTAEALAEVAARDEQSTLDLLAALASKSLVETDRADGRSRYRLLETVRLFCLDRLHEHGESAAVRRAHAEHFLHDALALPPRLDDLPLGVDRSMCRIRIDPVPDEVGADLANEVAALSWLDRQGELASVGRLSARIPTLLGHIGFLDPTWRYLGREDVAGALADDPAELALYWTASAQNACYIGAFDAAQRHGEGAMSAATDPATRSAAAAYVALANVGLAPDRVSEVVNAALGEAPADARATRLLLRGQQALSLVRLGRLEEAVEQLEPHARSGDTLAAAEQLLVLHVLGEDERAERIPIPPDAYPSSAALWSYRWPLARALGCAARGDADGAARGLLEALDLVALSPLHHEHDVLLGCAVAAHHAQDPWRALELITAVGRRVVSPGSLALSQHYRDRSAAQLDPRRREAIEAVAPDLDPHRLLHVEMGRLRASLGRAASTASSVRVRRPTDDRASSS